MHNSEIMSSWSGGKDSCLACYKAMQDGYKVKHLLNFISRESGRGCFHGIEKDLIKLQAELIGIALTQKEVTADMKEYEKEFKQAVTTFKDKGIDKMVFGDIYLDEHKDWVERVCGDIGIAPLEPLWNKSPLSVAKEFVDLGFKSIVVSCQADKFDKDFVGRIIDRELLDELEKKSICPCGENGEFHTFVIDGPMFKKRINITEKEVVFKKGFWEYYFLDIRNYEVREKSHIGRGNEGESPSAAPQR